MDDTKHQFLEKGTPAHYLLGLRVLSNLVQVSRVMGEGSKVKFKTRRRLPE